MILSSIQYEEGYKQININFYAAHTFFFGMGC